MCYTVDNKTKKEKVKEVTKAKVMTDQEALEASFLSAFSHPKMYVVKSENPEMVDVARWGLVPSFINDSVKAKEYYVNTLNAKCETIFEKVSFKKSIMTRRCLIPINGFYEWRDINKTKYPYYISVKNQEVVSIGGIYDSWVDKSTGEIHTTFSMVTTKGNPLMNKIHNLKQRQPLLMSKDNASNWLKMNLNEDDVKELMQPMKEEFMAAHTIKKVNPRNADIFDEHIHDEFEYPELVFYE